MKLTPSKSNIKYCANLRAEILNKIAKNEFNYADYFPNSKTAIKLGFVEDPEISSCKVLLEKLLEGYTRMKENKNLSPSTYRGYKSIVTGKLIPYFGKYTIKEVTVPIIKEWLDTFKNATAKTVHNNLSVLKALFTEAFNDGLIEKNPIEQLIIAKAVKKVGKKSTYVPEPFTEEEKELIINSAKGQFRNLLQFGFWSGLRTSELIALKWEDVDLEEKTAYICRGKVENEEKDTKTGEDRELMLLPKALAALKNQQKYTKDSEFVFHNDNTKLPFTSSDIVSQNWERLLKKLDIKYRNSYQMRHTYASTLLSNGENIMWVATQLGHATVEMVIKKYGKWIPKKNKNGNGGGGYDFSGEY